jgi:signal transduction histidine kinase
VSDAADLSTPPQWWVDAALALGVTAYGVLEFALSDQAAGTQAVLLAIALSALPVLVMSRWPIAAGVLGAAGLCLTGLLVPEVGESFVPLLGPALTAFTAGRHGRLRGLLLVAAADALAVALGARLSEPDYDGGGIVFLTAATLLALAVGRASREMQLEADVLRDEAVALTRRRDEEVAAAAEAERLRIARELHDVLGHTISVMSIQAAAVRRRLLPEQEQEKAALTAVEEAARQSVVELRRLLGLLRDGDLDTHGDLGSSAQLMTIVDDARRAGASVSVDGIELVDQLPSGLATTVVRIVQEGLTNVLRHAPQAQAAVSFRRTGKGLSVSVVDDGAGTVARVGTTGFGLVGMRERVAVFGGRLVAGPRAGGGFELVAELPVVAA